MTISLPIDAGANELLSRNSLALLMAMILDQQVPMEKAFTAPRELVVRMGHEPTAEELADRDPEELAAIFAARPALHRFPKAMAARVQAVCRLIVDSYEGDPAKLWSTAATGTELLARIEALPGFGQDKARIFLALLGKQCGVTPPGWREAAGHFGAEGAHYSVADITDDQSLAAVRAHKQSMKAKAGKP